MIISAIVAVSNNQAIGKDNQLPWHLPADLKFFKRTTSGHPIIMGRKNYESIGQPLPKRSNIVVTRNKDYEAKGCIVVHTLKKALTKAKELDANEVFIIGGSEIYAQTMPLWDRLYLTEIDIDVPDADVYFPFVDFDQFELVNEEAHQKDEKNPYNYCFKVYERC